MSRSILKVKGIDLLGENEFLSFVECAEAIGIDPDWLACVVSFETGATFSPSQRNHWADAESRRRGIPYFGAVGLIQFMPETCAALLGMPKTRAACEEASRRFEQMLFTEQLEQVKRYMSTYASRIRSLEDCYLAVFYPAAMGRADDYVIGTRGAPGFLGRVFEQNAGFDGRGGPKDGNVTKGEICATIRAVRDAANGERFVFDSTSPTGSLIDLTNVAREADDEARRDVPTSSETPEA